MVKYLQDFIYGGPEQSEEQRAKCSCTIDARMLLVAFLTFMTYVMYHAQRISFSAVASSMTDEAGFTATKLGVMSTGYMFAYAIGQFICGRFADTVRPKRALVWGMLCCATLPIIEGLMGANGCGGEGFCYGLWICARMIEGLVQATGWTSTVAIMGNWFPQEGRGLIMGLWATNSNVGDIFGLSVSSALLDATEWYVILWLFAGGDGLQRTVGSSFCVVLCYWLFFLCQMFRFQKWNPTTRQPCRFNDLLDRGKYDLPKRCSSTLLIDMAV